MAALAKKRKRKVEWMHRRGMQKERKKLPSKVLYKVMQGAGGGSQHVHHP